MAKWKRGNRNTKYGKRREREMSIRESDKEVVEQKEEEFGERSVIC